ncbi:hypothetical protein TNCV_2401331 [Trichonephila clavipes]|nr:hypothetical protein TNCV_2401331 [Trichonephila clavipes]
MSGQKATDRHDIVARVFRLKVQKLMNVVTKGKVFGGVKCHMYSIEWQKRGVPHVHILIWLKQKLLPNQINNIISTEIPDPEEDKNLFDTVIKNMIHGPYGACNPASPYIQNGKCTKKYPRELIKETVHSDKGYTLYRRRASADGGKQVDIRSRNGEIKSFDNSWVVPYSPILGKLFNAHINVEACNSVCAIKYICKYINKGNDQAIFNLRNEGVVQALNEIQTYQAGRYVNSNEAEWRLLGFPLHERYPTVTHLAVHLENGQRTPVEIQPGVKASDALGRVYTVHVTNLECFCLRILLHHIRRPTNFTELEIVNSQECQTYREACEARRLLENDNHCDETMEEAVQCRSPDKIRELYATLLSSCGFSNPQTLWDKYKEYMVRRYFISTVASTYRYDFQ